MKTIHISGGIPLQGEVEIQGSKNAALPILAATILTKGSNRIENCPKISDVFHMITLLRSMGCNVFWDDGGIVISADGICKNVMPKEESISMRSSITLLGAILGRMNEAVMEYPGGCIIGKRPIDLHQKALEKMGVLFSEKEDKIYASVTNLKGAEICFPFPSVGATENVILAATKAQGNTIIQNAAKEPEIVALCQYLNFCGAKISGYGTDCIEITGVETLHGGEYCVPADRIVAGTYLYGCLLTGGNVFLRNIDGEDLRAVLLQSEMMGAQFQMLENGIYIQAPVKLQSNCMVRTEVFPGFPTDLQSPLLVAMSVSDGDGFIEETIFENRFHIVEPLRKMGADIAILDQQHLHVRGVEFLTGCKICAKELRGGAALVLAGLCAKGETTVENCEFIDRGYENICKDLRELGARIYCV